MIKHGNQVEQPDLIPKYIFSMIDYNILTQITHSLGGGNVYISFTSCTTVICMHLGLDSITFSKVVKTYLPRQRLQTKSALSLLHEQEYTHSAYIVPSEK